MSDTITIPGYTIARKLGQGGMASVYLAVQRSFEREVALKVMSPLLNSDASFAARFKREARIVAQLSHASIVPVFDVGEHQSCHYLSMEYLSGGDLKRRILDGERDLGLALNVCTALSAALDIAHRKGFVHRDIKPDNILFREDGTPVLTDFGIARALDNGQSMTLAGMLVGTPDYMSPEQVKGLDLDGRSDLYSLGIVFYEILTGAAPFKADSTLSIALKQLDEPLPSLPPEYSAYQEFLDCLTAKDREERFASGAEVARALRVIGTERSVRGRLSPRSPATPQTSVNGVPAASTLPPAPQTYASQVTLARLRGVTPDPVPESEISQSGTAWSRTDVPPAVTQDSEPPRIKRFGLRSRPLWIAAAAVAAVAVGAALIIGGLRKGSHEPSSATASTRTLPRAPNAAQPAAPAQSALPAEATGLAPAVAPPETLTSNTTDVAPPVPTTPTPSEDSAPAAGSAVPAAAPADASLRQAQTLARRKRLAEERRQRKEDEARMLAQHTAEERAAQLQAQETQIQEKLLAAKREFSSGAFWKPAGANAADHYRDILRMQPMRPEALAGAQRVANVLVAEAAQTESVGDVYNTRLLLEQIESLQPDHPKLADLVARLEQLQTQPTSADSRNRERLERAAKYMARVEQDLGRSPLDYRAVDAATDEYDRALSAASMAPGLPSLRERLISAYAVAVRTEIDNHDPKRAQKLISTAHKRHWTSEELDQLEASVKAEAAPTSAAPIKEAAESGDEH